MQLWHVGPNSVGQLWDLLSFQYWDFTHKSSFGTWRIQWDEISSVEIGEVDGTLVFHGSNKRFILAPPTGWSGTDKHNALDLVIEQLQSRNLSPKLSRTTAYKIMKNTRVSTNFNPNKKGKTP